MKTSHLPSILLSIVLLLGPFTVAITEPAPAPQTGVIVDKPGAPDERRIRPIEDEIVSLIQGMDPVTREVTEINTVLRQANDEKRAITRDQRHRKYLEIRTALEVLVRNNNEPQSPGQSSQEIREKADAYAGQISAWLKNDINNSLKLLAALDEKVKTHPGPTRLNFGSR